MPSIQRIEREGGRAEIIATELDGKRFNGPNDLVFGPDGRLYFTDPGTYRPADPEPSYLFVLDARRHAAGSSRSSTRRRSRTASPIEADGSVVWAESYTGMVRRLRLDTGAIEDIARLPGEKPIADGMAVGADGRSTSRP